jgi:hypothetical protein
MFRQFFATISVPAVLAALLTAGEARAQPRPPGPPPMRPPAPPAFRPPAPPAVRPPAPPAAPPAVRPPAPLSSRFARPTLSPSRPALLARPNVGGSPSLTSRRPGGWAPPVVNRGWDRPTAALSARRSTTFDRGNIIATVNRGNGGLNDHRPFHRTGYVHPRSTYGWVGSFSAYYGYYGGGYDSSYYPYYSGGGYSYGSDPYSYSYLYGGSYPSLGSLSGQGDSGSSDRPARSSAASDEEAKEAKEAKTEKETAAERRMDLARRAFQKGDYATAQGECERAIRLLPGDANLHEFLALCQFAQEEYKDASATLHEVLAAGPGWGWDTLSSFYASEKTYTAQLRALEKYVKDNPRDAAGRFVLAYHYLALDEREAAAEQLREVVKLQPRDKTSPGILEALEGVKDGKDAARRPAPKR